MPINKTFALKKATLETRESLDERVNIVIFWYDDKNQISATLFYDETLDDLTILQGDNEPFSLSGRTALGLFQSITYTFRFFGGILEFISNIIPSAKSTLVAEHLLDQSTPSQAVFGFKFLVWLKMPYKYAELSRKQMREIKGSPSENPIALDDIQVDQVILF